jgi:hypothetical protein
MISDRRKSEKRENEKDRIKNQEIWNIRKRGYLVSELPIKFPEYMPYFYSIITDDISRIYVRKNPLPRYSSVNHEYDVFNKEGLYLYKIHLDHYPDVIKNGYIYTRIANEETGEEQVKRFSIKNWRLMKRDS